jgi:hypothetical protein
MRVLPLALLLVTAPPLSAQCRLCAPGTTTTASEPARPLSIEVESALDLGRAAANGAAGSISLDERSGARRVEGMTDLGGFAIKGRVRLTGAPFARVRVSMPSTVRLIAPDGAMAEAVDLRLDLPTDAALDGAGTLSFTFGGRLIVPGGVAGDFRGRIPITADYQ